MKGMQRSAARSRRGSPGRQTTPAATLFQQALDAMRSGQHQAAEEGYRRCLALDPAHAAACHHLGLLAARRLDHSAAATLIGKAVALDPTNAKAHIDLSMVLRHLGRIDEAIQVASAAAQSARGTAAHDHELGLVRLAKGDLEAAVAAFAKAAARDPRSAPSFFWQADALRRLGRLAPALDACNRGLAIAPQNTDGLNTRGLTLDEAGEAEAALADFLEAFRINPNDTVTCVNVAHMYLQDQKLDEAMRYVRLALARDPKHTAALGNLGTIYQRQGRMKEAIETFSRAIDYDPTCTRHYVNLASLLIAMGQSATAVAACRLAVSLAPDDAEAQYNLAAALRQKRDLPESIEAYRRAHALGRAEALADICHLRQQICDWDGLAEDLNRVGATTYRVGKSVAPFTVVTSMDSPAEQRLSAEVYGDTFPRLPQPLASYRPMSATRLNERIRIGYLSSDFFDHATTSLMVQLIERHDRTRFKLVAYSSGPDDGSAMRRRVVAAFDEFIDIRAASHIEAARRILADEIDILIDLKGYTEHARTAVMAYRPAPIQVNYLGYPGTMGNRFVDYIVADPFVIPADHAPRYAEAVVQLPHCYQPNDRSRPVAADIGSRADFGLPAEGFVFCCFNNSYKITPEVFAIWADVLHAVPGAVLWLLEHTDAAAANLRREAARAGLGAERILFAPRVKADQHIARMGLADLFLDTLPVNAHTTASEALWIGLPVLTCAGETFVSRVAGSLLHAIGLPELVTGSLADYAAAAIDLARHPTKLKLLRARLAANRLVAPLFDIDRYTANFETALLRMCELRNAGRPPEPIMVAEPPVPAGQI